MSKQIVLTDLNDNGKVQWVVYLDDKVVNFGYEDDRFDAFKVACYTYDKI